MRWGCGCISYFFLLHKYPRTKHQMKIQKSINYLEVWGEAMSVCHADKPQLVLLRWTRRGANLQMKNQVTRRRENLQMKMFTFMITLFLQKQVSPAAASLLPSLSSASRSPLAGLRARALPPPSHKQYFLFWVLQMVLLRWQWWWHSSTSSPASFPSGISFTGGILQVLWAQKQCPSAFTFHSPSPPPPSQSTTGQHPNLTLSDAIATGVVTPQRYLAGWGCGVVACVYVCKKVGVFG